MKRIETRRGNGDKLLKSNKNWSPRAHLLRLQSINEAEERSCHSYEPRRENAIENEKEESGARDKPDSSLFLWKDCCLIDPFALRKIKKRVFE